MYLKETCAGGTIATAPVGLIDPSQTEKIPEVLAQFEAVQP
jgi:hypothetical protein